MGLNCCCRCTLLFFYIYIYLNWLLIMIMVSNNYYNNKIEKRQNKSTSARIVLSLSLKHIYLFIVAICLPLSRANWKMLTHQNISTTNGKERSCSLYLSILFTLKCVSFVPLDISNEWCSFLYTLLHVCHIHRHAFIFLSFRFIFLLKSIFFFIRLFVVIL